MNQHDNSPIDINDYLLQYTDRTTGCWIWTHPNKGKIISTKRAGKQYHGRRPQSVAWEVEKGAKPTGILRPTCGNNDCINPDHQLETQKIITNTGNKTKKMETLKIESYLFWKMDNAGLIDWSNYGIPVYEGKKVKVLKNVQKVNAKF